MPKYRVTIELEVADFDAVNDVAADELVNSYIDKIAAIEDPVIIWPSAAWQLVEVTEEASES